MSMFFLQIFLLYFYLHDDVKLIKTIVISHVSHLYFVLIRNLDCSQVTDTNDNAPTFQSTAYSFDVPENVPRGSRVGQVVATDIDAEGPNSHLSYVLISDWANDVFSLNPSTGVFTLTASLDYEQVGTSERISPSRSIIRSSVVNKAINDRRNSDLVVLRSLFMLTEKFEFPMNRYFADYE